MPLTIKCYTYHKDFYYLVMDQVGRVWDILTIDKGVYTFAMVYDNEAQRMLSLDEVIGEFHKEYKAGHFVTIHKGKIYDMIQRNAWRFVSPIGQSGNLSEGIITVAISEK